MDNRKLRVEFEWLLASNSRDLVSNLVPQGRCPGFSQISSIPPKGYMDSNLK